MWWHHLRMILNFLQPHSIRRRHIDWSWCWKRTWSDHEESKSLNSLFFFGAIFLLFFFDTIHTSIVLWTNLNSHTIILFSFFFCSNFCSFILLFFFVWIKERLSKCHNINITNKSFKQCSTICQTLENIVFVINRGHVAYWCLSLSFLSCTKNSNKWVSCFWNDLHLVLPLHVPCVRLRVQFLPSNIYSVNLTEMNFCHGYFFWFFFFVLFFCSFFLIFFK